jgi:hypothetical protein
LAQDESVCWPVWMEPRERNRTIFMAVGLAGHDPATSRL